MAKVAFEDLSGTSTPVTENPFDGILQACNNDPKLIQSRYHTHRITRNAQQKSKILSADFSGWILDPVLTKLEGPQAETSFKDPRNCLVFWARPPQKVKNLIQLIQEKLKHAVPGLWLMPIPNLHMTAMEVTHSLTAPEIDALVTTLQPSAKTIADLPSQPGHRARLVKPMLSYDAAALALSFVPAAAADDGEDEGEEDSGKFTYHHLRRTLHSAISAAGVPVASRYVVPSAHLTIARFNSPNPFDPNSPLDAEAGIALHRREALVREIELINAWLESEFWPAAATAAVDGVELDREGEVEEEGGKEKQQQLIKPGGEWIVGEEKGLDFRKGTLWYGGGETIYLGKGIEV